MNLTHLMIGCLSNCLIQTFSGSLIAFYQVFIIVNFWLLVGQNKLWDIVMIFFCLIDKMINLKIWQLK